METMPPLLIFQTNNFMNRNITPLILIVLALGLFFTFTNGRITELKSIQAVNNNYLQAINNSVDLIKNRDNVLKSYNSLSDEDKSRLDKMLPNNVDNVRLIIDVTNIGARHGIPLKNITTSAPDGSQGASGSGATTPATSQASANQVSGVVTVSFSFSASYQNFLAFLGDIQSSLRVLDISHLTVSANDSGTYDFSIALQTYWLK